MRLVFFIILFLFHCNFKTKEENQKEELINYLINLWLSPKENCINYNLPDNPTYIDLKNQNVFSNCKRCHSPGESAVSYLDVEDYNSLRSKIIPFEPFNSTLYLSITTGNMSSYSNSCINSAVKKWIEKGGN